ncbi:MAG: prepilin-type N-terminal cleavage/methylation domain-containing protein [Planctomycetales bacterium]|nr:prepilin-type N-terminal cleavage/methylation domain-containing protein [Planctomycetales bacterium]
MKEDAGFTLVELLVSMLLALIATTLASSVYLITARLVDGWREGVRLENTFHQTITRLAEDAYDVVAIESRSDATVSLVRADGDTLLYLLQNGVLYRNGRAMNDASFVAHMACRRTVAADSPARVVVAFSLAGRRRSLAVETVIAQRALVPWLPVFTNRSEWP